MRNKELNPCCFLCMLLGSVSFLMAASEGRSF